MCPDEPKPSNTFLYHVLEAANGSDDRLDLQGRSTLEEMGIFEDEWDESGRAPWREGAWRELRQASHKRREKIYRAGGRGWWSFEDKSRIVWPDGKEPQKIAPEEKFKTFGTLEEAKVFILSLK